MWYLTPKSGIHCSVQRPLDQKAGEHVHRHESDYSESVCGLNMMSPKCMKDHGVSCQYAHVTEHSSWSISSSIHVFAPTDTSINILIFILIIESRVWYYVKQNRIKTTDRIIKTLPPPAKLITFTNAFLKAWNEYTAY